MIYNKFLFVLCICAGLSISNNVSSADPVPAAKPIIWSLNVDTLKSNDSYLLQQGGGIVPNSSFGLICLQNPIAMSTSGNYEFVSIACQYSGGNLLFSTKCNKFLSNSNMAIVRLGYGFGNVTFALSCSNL